MELPDFDNLTPKQVRKWGLEMTRRAREWGEIKATLMANCRPGQMLGRGLEYDDTKAVIHNLVSILEKLALSEDKTERDGHEIREAELLQEVERLRVYGQLMVFLARDDIRVGLGEGTDLVVHHHHWQFEGRAKNVLAAARVAMLMERKQAAVSASQPKPLSPD